MDDFLKNIDKSKFDTSSYIKKVEKPWGYELHFTPDDLPYMGKVLHINAGKRPSLQAHDQKTESWFLIKGKVKLIIENNKGELEEVDMQTGVGYTTKLGQKHRLVGIEDSDVLEVSTPELGNTYRLEDDYARPTETEELRKNPNRGWNEKS
ncbi:cupin [Candidatus Daviesbacteria bacterium]|nr:cupin [Candidatus Daviesbacteria bacterium]